MLDYILIGGKRLLLPDLVNFWEMTMTYGEDEDRPWDGGGERNTTLERSLYVA